MTIPENDLNLKVMYNDLPLGDALIFEPQGFSLAGIRRFLIKYSDWSESEIDKITLSELRDVAKELREKMNIESEEEETEDEVESDEDQTD